MNTVQHDNHTLILRDGDNEAGPLSGYTTVPTERWKATVLLAEAKARDLAVMALSTEARDASVKIVKIEKRQGWILVVLQTLTFLNLLSVLASMVAA